MKLALKSIFLIFTYFFIGCANAQISQQALQLEAQTLSRSFYSRMQSDNELKKISEKIWFDDVKSTPLRYYSNTGKVSDDEKTAIERLNQLTIIFNSERENLIRKYNLPVADLVGLANSAVSSLVVDLYVQKITYGEYAIKRREVATNFDAAIIHRGQQLTAAENQKRDAAFSGLQNYLLNQNLVNALNQPARISPFTCTRMGAMVNCW